MNAEVMHALERARKKLVIVEGMKDARALRSLGFERIVALKNRPLYEVIESVHAAEVVILTDLDREGKRLFAILREGLQRNGVKIDTSLREALFRTKARQIEGLPNLF